LTAFEPYDRWAENSSWLAVVDLTSWYSGPLELITRRYPVDLSKMRERLEQDLAEDFDLAVHLGQSPGSPLIRLEAVGLNLRECGRPLLRGGPTAYCTSLDLGGCVERLVASGIPAQVSYHAGAHLCNAAFYFSQHLSEMTGGRTRSLFVHLPLAPGQVAGQATPLASMSTPMASAAIALITEHLAASC
jgi:pyroglutamyl-peptidase